VQTAGQGARRRGTVRVDSSRGRDSCRLLTRREERLRCSLARLPLALGRGCFPTFGWPHRLFWRPAEVGWRVLLLLGAGCSSAAGSGAWTANRLDPPTVGRRCFLTSGLRQRARSWQAPWSSGWTPMRSDAMLGFSAKIAVSLLPLLLCRPGSQRLAAQAFRVSCPLVLRTSFLLSCRLQHLRF